MEKFKFNTEIRDSIRTQLGLSKNNIVIGNVAGFLPVKNHKYIVELAEKLVSVDDNYKFILLGDGELYGEINQLIIDKQLESNIFLLGNKTDAYLYYNAMDLFVLPSLYEGLPVVLIEAQANGLISIISSNISEEVDKTSTIHFCHLKNLNKWIDLISSIKYDRINQSKKSCEMLEQQEYSVTYNSQKLMKFYYSSIGDAK